jgi:hypothetical protein
MADPIGTTSGPSRAPAKPAPARRAIAGRTAPRTSAAAAARPVVSAPAAAAPAANAAPAVTVQVNPEQKPTAAPRENPMAMYGMTVVLAGFVAILLSVAIVLNYKVADASAILGTIITAIAGLGGAFFGVAIGQQGTNTANKERAASEASKDAAQAQTLRFAAYMDPEIAKRLVE